MGHTELRELCVMQKRRRIIMMGNRFGEPIRFMLPTYWDIKEGEGYASDEWKARKQRKDDEGALMNWRKQHETQMPTA